LKLGTYVANELTIPESILLLALNDETGERKGAYIDYGLAGAALTELVLAGRLAEVGEPPKKLAVVDTKPLGDGYIDACLKVVVGCSSERNAREYVNALAGNRALTDPLYDRLAARGIISETKSKILFFTRTTYPEANPAPERELEHRLRAIISGTGPVDVRDGAIIALAYYSDILQHNFDRDLLKTHKARIKAIAEGSMLPASATKAAIEAVHAAVMIAAMIPIIVVAAT
jgi:hypothetical protein